MKDDIALYRLEDVREGQSHSIELKVDEAGIDEFARVSGDYSPIHMDGVFAAGRGFSGRVAHGFLLGSYISRMVGMHLPGRNALLQSADLKFLRPVYAGDKIKVTAVVDQVSEGTRTVVLKVGIVNTSTGKVHVRGKVQVGFTEETPE